MHSKGENSMAVCGFGCKNSLVGLPIGPGRLCQHNFKHNRLSVLVRIMLE